MKLDYEKMIKDANRLMDDNHDFLFDIECKQLPDSKKYTQKESQKMAEILGQVYLISHCIHCRSCQSKYLIK